MSALGPKGQKAVLDLAVRACQDYAAHVPVSADDTRHEFTVTVAVNGRPLVPQTIRAYSMTEALVRAVAVPFPDWWPAEDPDETAQQAPTADDDDKESTKDEETAGNSAD